MTFADLTAKQPKPPAKAPSKGAGLLTDFLLGLAPVAFIMWLAGVAMNKGFGVHVPFIAGSILLFTALITVKVATVAAANVWHGARVRADVTFLVASMAAQRELQQQAGGDLTGLLDSLMKPPADSDNAGYL